MASKFFAGVAAVNITPRRGLPLLGNFRSDYAARGMHDPLMARALVFGGARGKPEAAIVSLDLGIIDRHNTAFLREQAAKSIPMPPENILWAATHTHSGPALAAIGLPLAPENAIEQILSKAATSVAKAVAVMEPAELIFGNVNEYRLSNNRRLLGRDGKTHMNWEMLNPSLVRRALGPVDPDVGVLGVKTGRGLKTAAVNFGLHPAVLAGDNWLYSADFPGYLGEAMRRIHGDDVETLFFNGCCGNVNHIDWRDPTQGRGYQMTQRIGYMLAAAATTAIRQARPVKGLPIMVAKTKVALQRMPVTEKQRRWAQSVIQRVKSKPSAGQVDGLPDDYYASIMLKMHANQNEDDIVEVMAIRLGDLAIVGLPGEIFCEFGLEIKKRSPARHTMVVELANDEIGYLPTRKSFKQGGYEPTPGTTFYRSGAGEKLTQAAIKLVRGLFGGKS